MSLGGSNDFVECLGGGAVAEGGSGAVVQFVGDGVEVGLVAGDGGSFGQVAVGQIREPGQGFGPATACGCAG